MDVCCQVQVPATSRSLVQRNRTEFTLTYNKNMRVRHSEASCDISLIGFVFYGEMWLAPRPTPMLEDHPLSAVRDCLFKIFAVTLHNWRPFLHPQPEDAPCRGDRDPLITVTGTHLAITVIGTHLAITETGTHLAITVIGTHLAITVTGTHLSLWQGPT
jgi:hypothetical protein